MTDKPKRERKVGKHTSYETDGTSYWLAPYYVEEMGSIEDQMRALDAVIEATVRSVAEARRHVEAQRRKWWEKVSEELGLDTTRAYAFDRLERRIAPSGEPEAKE